MGVSFRIRNLFLAAGMVFLTLLPAAAREKSDFITLKNGNSFYGEINKLERGMLTVNADMMGTVQIKWEDVVSVTSKYVFAVRDTRGILYLGTLQETPDSRKVNIAGPRPVSDLDHQMIVEISEVGGSIWNRFSGLIDLGFTFAKASDRTQLNLSSQLNYTSERRAAQATYDVMLSNSKGEQDINRAALTLSGNYSIGKKWHVFSKGKLEHNLELELDQRFSFLGGPSYDILKTNRSLLMLFGGISYTNEAYASQGNFNNAEGAVGVEVQFFKLYTPKIDFVGGFSVYPNITTSGRVRLEFDTKLRLEIFKDFFVSFSYYDSYDSKPPSETATKHDFGFVSGVTWSFNR